MAPWLHAPLWTVDAPSDERTSQLKTPALSVEGIAGKLHTPSIAQSCYT